MLCVSPAEVCSAGARMHVPHVYLATEHKKLGFGEFFGLLPVYGLVRLRMLNHSQGNIPETETLLLICSQDSTNPTSAHNVITWDALRPATNNQNTRTEISQAMA
eukprot:550782-Amphidinium_carterae.1